MYISFGYYTFNLGMQSFFGHMYEHGYVQFICVCTIHFSMYSLYMYNSRGMIWACTTLIYSLFWSGIFYLRLGLFQYHTRIWVIFWYYTSFGYNIGNYTRMYSLCLEYRCVKQVYRAWVRGRARARAGYGLVRA